MTTKLSDGHREQKLVDVDVVRHEYVGGASARHVFRMADEGLMPWGVKLGALRRWRRDELEAWVAGGCKPVVGNVADGGANS